MTRRAACLLSFLLLFCGCPAAPPAEKSGPKTVSRGTIGFSALTLKNPFFKIIGDTLASSAKEQGFEVIVNDAERDVNEQSKHIDNFIAQGVTAIVINPTDRLAIGPAIKKANQAGIPVFTCDLQCEAEGIDVAGHVGTDNFQGGKLAGDAMIEALGSGGGKIMVLHFKQAQSCVFRVNGFTETITAHNQANPMAKIEIVSELEGGGLQDESYRATADALQAHPDLSGIFAINDPSALGAYAALKQAGKTDQVKIVGFDGQLEGKQAIKEGKIYADPVQFPEKMGTQTVKNVVLFLNGEPFEKVELIPTELYRKADADKDPALK
ncbi:substrate-binding domain-containing protein [Planctomicrobium piriforme]|uniref:Ribose transport system substrate-binding protein n=1 Tax=Planctomicrobium piriforme TaxID=1576369 RepID=A0A1I3KR45_9PLAN|nr:substrate-binding domain-containing protein [Planctomicrobium piriforme]SFI74979.1 ribose transport system substrate-binding protein [Planctomicrobium piriforme]